MTLLETPYGPTWCLGIGLAILLSGVSNQRLGRIYVRWYHRWALVPVLFYFSFWLSAIAMRHGFRSPEAPQAIQDANYMLLSARQLFSELFLRR